MKNIVLIVDSLVGGGAEKVNIRLAEMLGNNNIVTVIILKNIIDIPTNNVTIETLNYKKKKKKIFNTLYFSNKLKEKLKEIENIHNKKIDFVIGSLGLTHKLMNKINQNNFYYAVHSTLSNSKLDTKKGLKRIFKHKELIKLYNNKNIICVSNGVHTDLLNLNIKPKTIQTIYNPFNFDELHNLSNQKINFEFPNKYITNIGRLSRVKRHDFLLQSFNLIKDKELKLILVGKGEEEKSIRKLIKELKLEDRVIIAGFQKNPYPIIKNAKALILSSDYEGLPTVIIESLILNTKVISVDCPHGPKEILNLAYPNGLCIDKTPKGLALKIEENLNSSEKIDSRIKIFSQDEILKKYMNF